MLDCGLSKYLDRISLSGKTDYHCKVKETLFIRELQPALNANIIIIIIIIIILVIYIALISYVQGALQHFVNISSEKLYISFYRQFPFETS